MKVCTWVFFSMVHLRLEIFKIQNIILYSNNEWDSKHTLNENINNTNMDGDPNKNSTVTISKHFSMLNESPMSCFTNPNSNFLTNGWFFNILGVQENPKIAKYRIISHNEPWEAYNESKRTCMKWIIAIYRYLHAFQLKNINLRIISKKFWNKD